MTDNKSQTPPTKQEPAEKGFVDSAKDTFNSTLSDVSSWTGDSWGVVKSYFDAAKKEYHYFNEQGPSYLSNFKKDYVFTVNPDYRMIGHAGVTLSWIVISLRLRRGVFYTIRDSAFLYFTYGALFNPEVVNPFLK